MILNFLSGQKEPFFQSLKTYYNKYGYLTPKQLQCVVKAMTNDKAPAYSYVPGDELLVKSWIARKYAKELNLKYFFRNIKIKEVHGESNKAIKVSIEFVSRPATSCHLCGLPLETEASKATGIGPVCVKYLGIKQLKKENAKEILQKIEEEAKIAGVVGPIWIPKSQIVTKCQEILFGDEGI